MLPTGTSTESVEHGQVTIDLGIKRRFSDSPASLSDVDLAAGAVLNKRRLQVFARHIALTEPVEEMDIGENEITVKMDGVGRLLGVMPVTRTYDVTTSFSRQVDDISVKTVDAWWGWLVRDADQQQLAAAIKDTVDSGQYFSVTQLRAAVLQAIIDSINSTGN